MPGVFPGSADGMAPRLPRGFFLGHAPEKFRGPFDFIGFPGRKRLLFSVFTRSVTEMPVQRASSINTFTKEGQMTQPAAEPMLTENGVAFTVSVDFVKRDCVISKDALVKLSRLQTGVADPMETFRAFEAKINGVARRMITANVQGTPLQLGPHSFY